MPFTESDDEQRPQDQPAATSTNIESSRSRPRADASSAPGPSVPAQVLGRRRRVVSQEPSQQFSSAEQSELPPAGQGSLPAAAHRPKRRRGNEANMPGEDETASQGNGAIPGQSNGSTTTVPQRTSASSTTNGALKAPVTNGSSNGDRPSKPGRRFYGHDREELTRILIQALSDMGHRDAADSVTRESGFELESVTITSFRSAILEGDWGEAESLLSGAVTADARPGTGNGLVLAPQADRDLMRFWVRQQKYLELLEQRDVTRALMVLRGELTPLNRDSGRLHRLSSLLMCRSSEDVMAQTSWDGAEGGSRKALLSNLSRSISPSVMLPENRLANLLSRVKQNELDSCMYHTDPKPPSLYAEHHCDRADFPSQLALELSDVLDEVWQVQFSHDGQKLAACGSGSTVVIWNTDNLSVHLRLTGHEGGVGNVSWSPDDSMIVTCALDKCARLWDAKRGTLSRTIGRYDEAVTGCVWSPAGTSFVIGSLDLQNGLRTIDVFADQPIEWGQRHRVQSLCGSDDGRWLVSVDDMQTIHVYDAESRELRFEMPIGSRPTSVAMSQDCQHLLVNKREGGAELIDLESKTTVQTFLGHTGGDFLIRSAFGGANENFVMSGSEDGNLLIWHKNSGTVIQRFHSHEPRCNVVVWNPTNTLMVASGGDDGIVRLWSNKTFGKQIKQRYEEYQS